jgi:hypothetical protein
MAQFQADQRADGDDTGLHHDLTVLVIEQVQAALAADTDPASPAAAPVVVAADPRTHRYLDLLSQINGWPSQPDLTRARMVHPRAEDPPLPRVAAMTQALTPVTPWPEGSWRCRQSPSALRIAKELKGRAVVDSC